MTRRSASASSSARWARARRCRCTSGCPDSMEGPTPISALIHAATMVTAGIFMVARMSPLFELSDTALVDSSPSSARPTALFMAFLGIVQNDIKRVVAYSTLSQLGYMTVALGVSAYSAAIFHLMTHAFFKALLFLGAGLGDHRDASRAGHAQHGRACASTCRSRTGHAVIGIAGARAAFRRSPASSPRTRSSRRRTCRRSRATATRTSAVIAGVFVTAFYSFRMLFHDVSRRRRASARAAHEADGDKHAHDASHDGAEPARMRARRPAEGEPVGGHGAADPARDSVGVRRAGSYIEPMLFGELLRQLDRRAAETTPCWTSSRRSGTASAPFIEHGLTEPAVLARRSPASSPPGICYLVNPALPARIAARRRRRSTRCSTTSTTSTASTTGSSPAARGASGDFLSNVGDRSIIDGFFVNGTARVVALASAVLRHMQSGYVYHYAFTMIIGLFALLSWWTLYRP